MFQIKKIHPFHFTSRFAYHVLCKGSFTLSKSEPVPVYADVFLWFLLHLTVNINSNSILREPIWKQCRFQFHFRPNINEPLPTLSSVIEMYLLPPGVGGFPMHWTERKPY